MDIERTKKCLFTFTRICVEIDLSKGLPSHILLKHEFFQWIQILDYENTTFRCFTCFQTRVLQGSSPLVKKPLKNKRGQTTNKKGCHSLDPIFLKEEEGEIKE